MTLMCRFSVMVYGYDIYSSGRVYRQCWASVGVVTASCMCRYLV
jgi:hypothetical protein